MTEDQIPAFVDDIIATGCPITAVGHNWYVISEIDLPEPEWERVSAAVDRVARSYGERDHLRLEIVAYLRGLGRCIEFRQDT